MRDKVLLNVALPATAKTYEFRVPLDLNVEDASGLMADVLARREPARFEAPRGGSDLMLCDEGGMAGDTLNPNETVRALVEQGVLYDGAPVALV